MSPGISPFASAAGLGRSFPGMTGMVRDSPALSKAWQAAKENAGPAVMQNYYPD
jgi:hypothetical protein